ncbi:MAG: zinc/manganese transport system permease protein [Sulfurimonas sp.]|jgi:zinc/manganese transport system permease protein
MSIVALFWPAFMLAILLVFIHAIFGLEIIRRGVIFTDLAIGQVASIGMAISITFMQGYYQTAMTLLFAVLAAVIITLATKRVKNIEAFIGLLYALGISSIMLILSKSAEGTELFSRLNAADILFTSSDDVIHSLMVYIPVAIIMFLIYPKLKGTLKEFVFFLMLAITVTSSVQTAGVLVVFTLLVAPAYSGLAQTKFTPLLFSWVFGSLSIILSLFISYYFDFPTGYTIIFITVFSSLIMAPIFFKKEQL